MKQTKNKKIEFEIKWWKDWLDADLLKREEMVGNLPIMKSIWSLKDIPEDLRKHAFSTMLNSFFEDLENAVYTQIELEKEK